MNIGFLVFLALLAGVECKSVSSEDYFRPLINTLSLRNDFAGLCAVRQEIFQKFQDEENLNEGRQLIEYLDQIGNDKAGFDPSSCSHPKSDFMDNMDITQFDPEVRFKDEEMSKNRAVQLDEFMSDDLSQDDKNKTLQTVLKSVLTITSNTSDTDEAINDYNIEQAQDFLNCDGCQNELSEEEIMSTFDDREQQKAEKLKIAVAVVGGIFLILTVLILVGFTIKEFCSP